VSRRLHPYPRCTATTKPGLPCSRYVTDGSQPPTCHIHQLAAKGGAGITRTAPVDPLAKLKKIAATDRHPKQFDAIKQLLDRTDCPSCAARQKREVAWRPLVPHFTPEERQVLHDAIATVHRMVEGVRQRVTLAGVTLTRSRPIADTDAAPDADDVDEVVAPSTPAPDVLGPDEVEL
jgi:hypothetical protein